jgi:hypothetical protein
MFSTKSPEEQAQEFRIRTALGLDNGPLPNVEIEWLRKYYEYLVANLSLPFEAQYVEESDFYRKPVYHQVQVLALLEPDKNPGQEYHGLICRTHATDREIEVPLVDLEIESDNPNFQNIEDYWYWIWNWRFDPRI